MSTRQSRTDSADDPETTTVEIRATGHVREAIGTHTLEYTFEGSTLADCLDAVLAKYDVAELLLAETEAEATAPGWAPTPDELSGTWRKNPEGEQTRRFAGSASTADSTSTSTASTPNSPTAIEWR